MSLTFSREEPSFDTIDTRAVELDCHRTFQASSNKATQSVANDQFMFDNMKKKPAGRRFPVLSALSGSTFCFHVRASGQRMAAIVQDHRSAYGFIMEPSGTNITLNNEKSEAVTAIALSRYDPSFVAVGTENGTVQLYSIDADGKNCDPWMDASIARKPIAALEFVPPPDGVTGFTSSLVALTRDGTMIAIDVFAGNEADETTGLLSSKHLSDVHHGSFKTQASVKLADFVSGGSEQPTGAVVILDEIFEKPLIVLGMSGGTLLTLGRTFDSEGYTWDCIKQLSLPSAVLSLALSTHGANSASKYPMLAAGLEVSDSLDTVCYTESVVSIKS